MLVMPAGRSYGQDTITSSSTLMVGRITILGNKVTHDKIILRELVFWTGQRVSPGEVDTLVKRSEENLINTSLFNFASVVIRKAGIRCDSLEAEVRVVERWYIWPVPVFDLGDRNFNVWWETRDLSRLSYGLAINWQNFRGRKETLKATVRLGYDQLYAVDYYKPNTNPAQTVGLGFGAGYASNHEVSYISSGNKQQFYREESGPARQDIFGYVRLTYRKNIHNTHEFRLGYNKMFFSDSLLLKNPSYSPGQAEQPGYLSMNYIFKSDYRDYHPYPLTGYYFDVELGRQGMDALDGSGMGITYILSTFRSYWQMRPRWYAASGLNCKFSIPGAQPYFLTWALGYGRDFIRGYEYYVVDGQRFGIWKNEIKFALVPRQVREIGMLRSVKFSKIHYALYLNAYTDLGYARNDDPSIKEGNDLQNQLLAGYGFGLDFVSYYDIVIRLEYSFNQMGENGIFLHFRAPI
jgi:outer membrane protein assembly factor BamA